MSELIKISKQNIDVLGTAGTVPNNLIFSSDYNTLKYFMSGTINVTTSGTDSEGSVAHNLGYYPYFTSYVNLFAGASVSNYNMCPGTFSDTGFYIYAQSFVNTSHIFFKVSTNVSSNTFTFRYFIFRNNLGL